MANLKTDNKQQTNYDAIVIGSGMSGGWAAKELAENGLKTLVLERGRDVKHVEDYPTMNKNPWEFKHRNELTREVREKNPIVSRCYAFREDAMHFFVKDYEHPYIQEKPFDWIRGYQVGGRSLMWARHTYRWSDYDFEGPLRDGYAVDWPIRYKDIAPWYDHVEHFVGIAGNKDGIPQLPDGDFLPPMDMNCIEQHFRDVVDRDYPGRDVIIGRTANITKPRPIHLKQGRVGCQYRNLCQRGCPFGAYFSSNSSTLPWAAQTGNMTMRPHSVVHSIIYDEDNQRASGVRVVDAESKEMIEFNARIIFVNAGSINSNLVLLNSTSSRFPNGLGNDNGLLGKYITFHNYRGDVTGRFDGDLDKTTSGRRPTSSYMPRFRNLEKQETDFIRGYAASISGARMDYEDTGDVGSSLKEKLDQPKSGPWRLTAGMQGEVIPKASNRVELDPDRTDEWGIPQVIFSVDYDENDEKMLKDFHDELSEMFEKAGFRDIQTNDTEQAPGLDIHEMGGARMGHDPKTSLLNKWNQMHACKNVFVTDGACMTSSATQNPSLTYMALTARAANYAVEELKKGNL